MKKIIYLPFAVLLLITASCSMSTNTVKENAANTPAKSTEKELFADLKVDVSDICYTLFRGKTDHLFAGKEMQQIP
jgi:hypothetical protein